MSDGYSSSGVMACLLIPPSCLRNGKGLFHACHQSCEARWAHWALDTAFLCRPGFDNIRKAFVCPRFVRRTSGCGRCPGGRATTRSPSAATEGPFGFTSCTFSTSGLSTRLEADINNDFGGSGSFLISAVCRIVLAL